MSTSTETPDPLAQTRSLLDELIQTLATGAPQQRLRVLERLADLFMAGARGYSSEQIALFDDLLQQLSSDIESKARARLAQRMAGADCAPPGLIRSFAFDDEITVAGPVLTRSNRLSEADLVENARTKSQAHLLAIAQRLRLSEAVTDVLVERGDRRVARQVAGNRGARISLAGYDKLTLRARRDRKLTLALGARSDLPRQCFLKLLESASASVRARLEAAHPQYAEFIGETVDELASRLQQETRAFSKEHATAERKARRRFRSTPVSDAHVHAPAHAQEFERTAIALARLGNFPLDLVERALIDKGEDMLLILAKAAGCSWTTARELLQMQAAGRALGPEDLRRCAEQYRKLKRETARHILQFRDERMKLRGQAFEHAGAPPQRPAASCIPLAALV